MPEPNLLLTPAELEVLQMYAQGLKRGEVADKRFVSTRTIDRHVENIREKTGFHTMYEAVAWGIKQGVIEI